MGMLVNTQEDVAQLVESKVLVNSIGSNEEAANMINNMCKEVACLEFFYEQQWETLNMYYNGYWPKNIAWLRKTYFSSPWNMIALFAGIILFAFTIVQTIFTIKSAVVLKVLSSFVVQLNCNLYNTIRTIEVVSFFYTVWLIPLKW
ncbi:hypothetical protein Hanom_Chr01g00021631 [Helianthus anomalus]